MCGKIVVLTLMVVSAFVRFSKVSPRSSSASHNDESSCLMSHLLTEGMRVRTLNPNLSFASAKKIVCCVWNSLLTRSPLFIMLRLLGQQANCERMSCLFETTSRRWLIVMDWFEIHVEALSVVPISLAVLVRIGEQIDPVTSSKAAKIILKCASHMSA